MSDIIEENCEKCMHTRPMASYAIVLKNAKLLACNN